MSTPSQECARIKVITPLNQQFIGGGPSAQRKDPGDSIDGDSDDARTQGPWIGSQIGELLRCFRFDPALRRHQRAIALYFRIGGLVVFGLLAGLVALLVQRERRRRA